MSTTFALIRNVEEKTQRDFKTIYKLLGIERRELLELLIQVFNYARHTEELLTQFSTKLNEEDREEFINSLTEQDIHTLNTLKEFNRRVRQI